MPSKTKKYKWRNSTEKEQLTKDLLDGTIPLTAGVREAQRARPEYQDMGEIFVSRFRSLKGQIKEQLKEAEPDYLAYQRDRVIYPVQDTLPNGVPRWQGSEGERLLAEDLRVDSGLGGKQPMEIWQSRPEYQVFSLKVFRDHIYQMRAKGKRRAFYLHLKQKKQVSNPQPALPDTV